MDSAASPDPEPLPGRPRTRPFHPNPRPPARPGRWPPVPLPRSAAVAWLAALLLGLEGCSAPIWVGELRRAMRKPGQALVDLPEKVARQYDCDDEQLPLFGSEKNELDLVRVDPGGESNHRMVYAICPARPTEVIAGTRVTRIRFKGKAIVTDTVEPFEIEPGRWIVDAG